MSSVLPIAFMNSSKVPRSAGWPEITTLSPLAADNDRIRGGPEAANPLRRYLAVPQLIVSVLVDVQHGLGHRDLDSVTVPGP